MLTISIERGHQMVVDIHSSSHDSKRLENSQERTSEDGSETHSNRWRSESPAGCISVFYLIPASELGDWLRANRRKLDRTI